MGTRIKFRICTWNVGNAQPPADLKEWLGAGADDYDLIVVGAQEANFGAEKPTATPSPVASAYELTGTEGMEFPPMSPCTPSNPSVSQSSSRFRKLGKVISGMTKPTSLGRTKKIENGQKGGEPVDSSLPKLSHSLPLLSDPDMIAEVNRRMSEDSSGTNSFDSRGIPVISLRKFVDKDSTQYEKLDESLLLKVRKPSGECVNVLKKGSMDDPLGEMFKSGGEVIGDMNRKDEALLLEGLKELCIDQDEPPSVVYDTPQVRKSRKLRYSVTKVLRTNEDNTEKGNENDEAGTRNSNSNMKKFSQVVEKNIPNEYHLIAKHHLMEIKLSIFIHERHRARVTKTEAVTEATGLGNVLGNKGAVAVKLTLDDTTFCFVCCHLAAHEGAKFLAQRNEDVVEIMRNIERDKTYGLPVIHQFNHIFWMGDLNYRLDLKHILPAAVTWCHEEKYKYVLDLITAGRYTDLTAFDELGREMQEGHVFSGFVEGKLNFAPTFKVARGKPREYQLIRVPSYCDRILWHSLPLHRNHVKLREYKSVESIDTSDHKPVYATFEMVIPHRIKIYPAPAPRDCLKCTMDFLKLRVSGLYQKTVENDDTGLKYQVLDDGALSVSPGCETGEEMEEKSGSHTRRVVTGTFHGNGMFLREKGIRIEVPLRADRRECRYDELPAIAIRPVVSLSDLTYKYVTIVFARMGSRQGSSCVLPFAKMVQIPGRHRISTDLELTKYGMGIAKVHVEVELVVSLETWVDTRNKVVNLKSRHR